MALKIQTVPILTGKSAERFEEKARIAESQKGTIDLSKEIEICKKILEKSKIKEGDK